MPRGFPWMKIFAIHSILSKIEYVKTTMVYLLYSWSVGNGMILHIHNHMSYCQCHEVSMLYYLTITYERHIQGFTKYHRVHIFSLHWYICYIFTCLPMRTSYLFKVSIMQYVNLQWLHINVLVYSKLEHIYLPSFNSM